MFSSSNSTLLHLVPSSMSFASPWGQTIILLNRLLIQPSEAWNYFFSYQFYASLQIPNFWHVVWAKKHNICRFFVSQHASLYYISRAIIFHLLEKKIVVLFNELVCSSRFSYFFNYQPKSCTLVKVPVNVSCDIFDSKKAVVVNSYAHQLIFLERSSIQVIPFNKVLYYS